MNKIFETKFTDRKWESQPTVFDEPKDPSARIDFLKDRIGIEVGFGHSCMHALNKPYALDILFNHLKILRQIAHSVDPKLISRRPYYEEAVRKQIVDTFLEYFNEDLTSRDEVEKLKKRLVVCTKELSKVEELEKALNELTEENKKCKKKVKILEEQNEEYKTRFLSDVSIKPGDKRLPF